MKLYGQTFHLYNIQKEKNAKRFYIQKARQFPLSFYIQNAWHFTLRNFSWLLLRLAFIYKNHDTLCYVAFLYTKAWYFTKGKKIELLFYIQKFGHFALRNFPLNFWNWRMGGNYIRKKQCTLNYIFICKKQYTLRYVFRCKNTDTLRFIFIYKKQCTSRCVFISKIYSIV